MRVTVDNLKVHAEIFLTDGEISSEILTGFANDLGNNVWTVTLRASRAKLSVKGIFRGNSFVGDYAYRRFLMADRGRWVVSKAQN